jgi:hypothetical protein
MRRQILFPITFLFVAFMMSARRKAPETRRRSRDEPQAAVEDQKPVGEFPRPGAVPVIAWP